MINPALGCANREVSDSLLRSSELAFLNRRRQELLSIDLGTFARKIVHHCARIGPGEHVLVMFTPESLGRPPFLPPEEDARLDAVIYVSTSIPHGR